MSPARLLVVDDHRVFAEGLEALFRAGPDFAPGGPVSEPGQVVGTVRSRQPDVVIMDVHLGEGNGIELTAQLAALPMPPVVVVLTAYSDAGTAADAIRAGAMGLVSRRDPA